MVSVLADLQQPPVRGGARKARTLRLAEAQREPIVSEPGIQLHSLMAELPEGKTSYLNRTVEREGNRFYRHWDLPSGEERLIPLERGRRGEFLVSSADAAYLRKQEVARQRYTSRQQVNAAVRESLKTAGIQVDDFFEALKGDFFSEHTEKKPGKTYFSFPSILINGNVLEMAVLKVENEWLFSTADAERVIAAEVAKRSDYIPAAELTKRLGVSKNSIHNWVKRGRLSGVKCGKETYVTAKSAMPLLLAKQHAFLAMPLGRALVYDVLVSTGISEHYFRENCKVVKDKRYFNYATVEDGNEAVRRIRICGELNRRPYMSKKDADYVRRKEEELKSWDSLEDFSARSKIPLSTLYSNLDSHDKTISISIVRGMYAKVRYAVIRHSIRINPSDAREVQDIFDTVGRRCVRLDRIPHAVRMLEPHADENRNLLYLTERVIPSNNGDGTVFRYNFFDVGVPFVALAAGNNGQDPALLVSRDGAELVRLYVGLFRGFPNASRHVCDIVDRALARSESDVDIAAMLVAKYVYMDTPPDVPAANRKWYRIFDGRIGGSREEKLRINEALMDILSRELPQRFVAAYPLYGQGTSNFTEPL